MTLEIPIQLEAALQSKASAQGVSPESYALSVLEREAKPSEDLQARWSEFFALAACLPQNTEGVSIPEEEATSWLDEARGEREAFQFA